MGQVHDFIRRRPALHILCGNVSLAEPIRVSDNMALMPLRPMGASLEASYVTGLAKLIGYDVDDAQHAAIERKGEAHRPAALCTVLVESGDTAEEIEEAGASQAVLLRMALTWVTRKRVVERVANAQVRRFWLNEYEGYNSRLRSDAISPIQNKVGAFLADPLLNRILTKPTSSLDLRRVLDRGDILLVNLSKGQLGEDTASLLGSLLVSQIGLAAISRADRPEAVRRDFFVYLDEFQSFGTLSLAGMLSELRKYGVGFVLAHQYLAQLDERVRDAVLGNVGTIIAFRLGLPDAEVIQKEFYPEFAAADLASLPNYQVYVRMLVKGRAEKAFSAETFNRASRAKTLQARFAI